jgi:hypothetical protein
MQAPFERSSAPDVVRSSGWRTCARSLPLSLSSCRRSSKSAAFRSRGAALALRTTPTTSRSYSIWPAKSRLPRMSSACSSRRLSAPLLASTSPFCSFAPTAIVRGSIPRCRINALYSSLNLRSAASWAIWCVAAVEWSVWWKRGTRPSWNTAACTPRRSASDSDEHTVAHCQFEYGSTVTHSKCANACPAIVTPDSPVDVKSVCAASPTPRSRRGARIRKPARVAEPDCGPWLRWPSFRRR